MREDIAESFLPYLAVQHRSDRISQSLANTIRQTIPTRIDYFNQQSFNLHPITIPEPSSVFLVASTIAGFSLRRGRRRLGF